MTVIKVVKISEVLRMIQDEEVKAKPASKPKTTEVYKQIDLTMAELNNELSRSEPSDIRLEYFFNKLAQLEKFL